MKRIVDSELSRSLGKWVRKDRVQTDEHWMHQAIVPQKLAARPGVYQETSGAAPESSQGHTRFGALPLTELG